MSVYEAIERIKKKFDGRDRAAFFTALVVGLLTHLPAMVRDIPNHDGLESIYSKQDLLTSGRWFLSTACGISSFYSIPWFIGLLSLVYLAITAVFTVRVLRIGGSYAAGLTGALLVTFPALVSDFAYIFTMDGYMLGLLFAVLAVYVTEKGRWGVFFGAILLALSLGIYQSYLAVAMVLCLYRAVLVFTDKEREHKVWSVVRYMVMGLQGLILYYVILRILLIVSHKELASYQGIGFEGEGRPGVIATVLSVYKDFAAFTLRSRIMAANPIAFAAMALFLLTALILLFKGVFLRKKNKEPRFWLAGLVLVILLPVCANMILLANPNVTYHSLMRYQWAFILAIAFSIMSKFAADDDRAFTVILSWIGTVSLFVMIFSFAVTDNVAYSNLAKRYEKTYAYSLRLLDRIETTEGYTKDMPVKMIGVVGDEAFPVTDVTGEVTGGMLGIPGDTLLYRPENYRLFFEHYLGATVNFMPAAADDFYFEDWYVAMHPFPAADSIVIRDGVMYIKTENHERY